MNDRTQTASAMGDHELVQFLHAHKDELSEKEQGFITNCSRNLQRYPSLTFKMRRWACSIGTRIQRGEMQSKYEELPNLKGVYDLFGHASEHVKFPKITFSTDRLGVIRLALAGQRSKYKGKIMMTDGRRFGENQWFGFIDTNGEFKAGKDPLRDEQIEFLEHFSTDPVRIAKEYAQESGHCCFCHKELTDEKSTVVGYGPVCAKNYGLPWGK